MNKILVVNQPLNNRGDEAAHKALIRKLLHQNPDVQIRVLFVDCYSPNGMQQFAIPSPNVKYININSTWWYPSIGPKALKTNHYFLWNLHPTTWDIKKQYKWADLIICAPGGICMGGFQDWNHLYFLQWAKQTHKPLAYYGRSLGPFPIATEDNRLFKKKSIEMMRYFSFCSIRDAESETIAKQLGISFTSTVDTAFLDFPNAELPYEIKQLTEGKKIIVFVPNSLTWHYAYKGKIQQKQLIDFFAKLAIKTLRVYEDHYILMLPQTFNDGDQSDINFFRKIAEKINSSRVLITADCYSSDIQQTLINKSKLVIGARYHSIVFAINQNIPFIALNYEHKMTGLLKKLQIGQCGIDIRNIDKDLQGIFAQFEEKLAGTQSYPEASTKAKAIAQKGFDEFYNSTICYFQNKN